MSLLDISHFLFRLMIPLEKGIVKHRIYWVLLFLLTTTVGLAQEPVFRHFVPKDGLPSTEVYVVRQDSKGYIWMMTDRGVCRYNGYEFHTYTTEDGLPSNTVLGMHEDHHGRIWFFTYMGGICYYKDNEFHIPSYNPDLKKVLETRVPLDMYVDELDQIWISKSDPGCIRIRPDGLIELLGRNQPGDTAVLNLKRVGPERLFVWQAGNYKVERFKLVLDLGSAIKKEYQIQNNSQVRRNRTLTWGISRERNGNRTVYIPFEQELVAIRDTVIQTYRFPSGLRPTGALHIDDQGNLWVGLFRHGVYRFRDGDLKSDPSLYLAGHSVSSICSDHESALWFSTLNNGVFYLSNINVKSVKSVQGRVNAIAAHDNVGVYAGTYDMQVLHIAQEDDGCFAVKSIPGINTEVNSLMFPSPDSLFVSCRFADLRLINTRPVIPRIRFFDLHVYQVEVNKNIGVAFSGSSRIRITKKDTIENFFLGDLGFSGRVEVIRFLNENTLLIGAFDGLWQLDLRSRKVRFLGDKTPLLASRINDIAIDSKGRVVLATIERGVLIMEKDSVYAIGRAEGLISNQCNKLMIDFASRIWVATNGGLARITFVPGERRRYRILNLDEGDGLSSNDIKDLAMYKDQVWMATGSGVCYFNHREEFIHAAPPLIEINQLRINSKEYSPDVPVTLAYSQNDINIHYQALAFRNPVQVTYEYRVEGLDTGFQVTRDRAVRLTNLAPGEYVFRVFARNSHGIRSTKAAEFRFVILPPFWERWWFQGAGILFFGGIVVTSVGLRIKQLKRQSRFMEELHRSKLEALCAQMNPHFIFNSLSSVQNYLLKNDASASSQFLARFSSLMRLTLENSIRTVVPLERDLEAVKTYVELEQMRMPGKFSFFLWVDPRINVFAVRVPPMLIQPMVENAIWHGIMPKKEDGYISIRIDPGKDCILICVEDNGVGRKKEPDPNKQVLQRRASSGTLLTRNRLLAIARFYRRKPRQDALVVEDLFDEDIRPCGTRVTLTVPV